MFIIFRVLRGVVEHITSSGPNARALGHFVLELTRLKMHRNCSVTSRALEGSHRAIFFHAKPFKARWFLCVPADVIKFCLLVTVRVCVVYGSQDKQ